MRCISPFDNGSYHMVTIRTNRTNRQLREGFLGMQLLRNILSPPNEMHFSIRQRVVSTNAHLLRIDDSKATQQLFLRIISIQVYWTTLKEAAQLSKVFQAKLYYSYTRDCGSQQLQVEITCHEKEWSKTPPFSATNGGKLFQ